MERPSTPSGFNKVILLIASVRRQLGFHLCTALLLGLCFFLPALLLGTSSLKKPSLNRRGTAELFEISRRARLVQSFEEDPAAPVPKLWQQQLRLRARPDQLARLGWLGPGWPRVVGKAPQLELEMTALPKQQQPGWLRLQLDVR